MKKFKQIIKSLNILIKFNILRHNSPFRNILVLAFSVLSLKNRISQVPL